MSNAASQADHAAVGDRVLEDSLAACVLSRGCASFSSQVLEAAGRRGPEGERQRFGQTFHSGLRPWLTEGHHREIMKMVAFPLRCPEVDMTESPAQS